MTVVVLDFVGQLHKVKGMSYCCSCWFFMMGMRMRMTTRMKIRVVGSRSHVGGVTNVLLLQRVLLFAFIVVAVGIGDGGGLCYFR